MSKHFELMQQMEAERLLNSEHAARPVDPTLNRAPTPSVQETSEGFQMPSRYQAAVLPQVPLIPYVPVSAPVTAPAFTHTPAAYQAPLLDEHPAADVAPIVTPNIQPLQTARPAAVAPKPVVEQRRWASAEAQRLVQQIFLAHAQVPPSVVVFAGIDSGNGCSEVCASVAESLAKTSGKSVCMIEANFRSPALSGLFATTNDHGLTEALLHPGPIRSFTKRVAQEDLWLLSSGSLNSDSSSLLTSEFMRSRIEELRREFSFILIDAAPLSRHSDAVVLGQLSNGLVMVLGADSTQRDAASEAATNLRSARVSILAAVLNKGNSPASQTNSSRP